MCTLISAKKTETILEKCPFSGTDTGGGGLLRVSMFSPANFLLRSFLRCGASNGWKTPRWSSKTALGAIKSENNQGPLFFFFLRQDTNRSVCNSWCGGGSCRLLTSFSRIKSSAATSAASRWWHCSTSAAITRARLQAVRFFFHVAFVAATTYWLINNCGFAMVKRFVPHWLWTDSPLIGMFLKSPSVDWTKRCSVLTVCSQQRLLIPWKKKKVLSVKVWSASALCAPLKHHLTVMTEL